LVAKKLDRPTALRWMCYNETVDYLLNRNEFAKVARK